MLSDHRLDEELAERRVEPRRPNWDSSSANRQGWYTLGMAATPAPQSNALTAEEVAFVIEIMRDPVRRQRAWQVIQETYLNPEFWQAGWSAVQRTYLNPDVWRAAWEVLESSLLNPAVWQEASKVLAEQSRADAEAALGEATLLVEALPAPSPDQAAFADAARQFDDALREGLGEPDGDDRSLGEGLAAVGLPQLLAILGAGLGVLHLSADALDDWAEVDIPDPITSTIAAVAGMVILVAVILKAVEALQDRHPD